MLTIIKNAQLVNEGDIYQSDVLIEDKIIKKIAAEINIEADKITQLVNTIQDVGYKSVQWNAANSFGKPVSAGVYLYPIRAGEFVQTKKMVVLK